MTPRRRRGPRLGTVRVRTTVAAMAVLGATLVVLAVAMVSVLGSTLTREVRQAVRLRAEGISAALEAGSGPGALAVAEQDEQLLQIVDDQGVVVASSPNVFGRPVVSRMRPGDLVTIRTPINDHDDFVAAAVAAETPKGRLTVIVAQALSDVSESTLIVTRLLSIGLPILGLLVAFVLWKVVGRALAPVEAIRGEVEAISAVELERRVPVPPGNDEIARLAMTMNQMLGRLEGAQAAQRRFISDASHELRSPVASIRQHAEVVLAHPGRIASTDLAETVLGEGLRMQHLIDDLLVLAKADERGLQIQRRPVDLDDLVFEEAGHLRDSTSLRVGTAAVSAARVDADVMAMRRVLRNLGDNAQRHARRDIAFALTEHDGAVTLRVDDDGPGIPEADRDRVVERFVRLDDARARDQGGSGLGLAIVAELVAAHGGSVLIAQSPLGGARIGITLPCSGVFRGRSGASRDDAGR